MRRSWAKKGRLWVAVLVLVLGVQLPGLALAHNKWYDRYITLEAGIGDDYYTYADGGSVGWAEGYVLQSYINMYDRTKDTAWLSKIVTHFDALKANATSVTGDAYVGWPASAYSKHRATNYGFETGASGDSTLPSGWTRFQATSSTAYRSSATNEKYAGTYGVAVKTQGTKWQALYQPLTGHVPGKIYTLRFWGRTNGGTGGGRAYIRNATTGAVIASKVFTNTTWAYMEVDFTAPSNSGQNLEVWVGHDRYNVTNLTAYFDEVRVQQKQRYMVHEGMVLQPVADFIMRVKGTPALHAAYLAKADEYLGFIENNTYPYWESYWRTFSTTAGDSGAYIAPRDDSQGEGCTLPHNMYSPFASTLVKLWQATGNSAYSDKAVRMARFFKSALSANGAVPSAYYWRYRDLPGSWDKNADGSYRCTRPDEDTSHANLDINFALTVWNAKLPGQPFAGSDITKLIATLKDVMWNGSYTSPNIGTYVDTSSGTAPSTSLVSWQLLAMGDNDVYKILGKLYDNSTMDHSTELLAMSHLWLWDAERAPNGDFEVPSPTDASLPARWARYQSTSSTAYMDTASAYNGEYGLRIKSDGALYQRLTYTFADWLPNTTYEVSFYARTNTGGGGFHVFVRDETAVTVLGQSVASDDTTWTKYTFTFTTPADTGHTLKLWLGNRYYTPTAAEAYFDEVRVKHAADSY